VRVGFKFFLFIILSIFSFISIAFEINPRCLNKFNPTGFESGSLFRIEVESVQLVPNHNQNFKYKDLLLNLTLGTGLYGEEHFNHLESINLIKILVRKDFGKKIQKIESSKHSSIDVSFAVLNNILKSKPSISLKLDAAITSIGHKSIFEKMNPLVRQHNIIMELLNLDKIESLSQELEHNYSFNHDAIPYLPFEYIDYNIKTREYQLNIRIHILLLCLPLEKSLII